MSYAIVITDKSNHIATVHTFEQKELWDWLQTPEVFPYNATSVTTTMPTELKQQVTVTIGSAENDKALHVANWTAFLDPESERIVLLDTYDEIVRELREQLGADHVYEGLAY